MTDLDRFRAQVLSWCAAHVPTDWRRTQAAVSDDQFVAFQKWWFAELHSAGYAVPHWPAEWGGGMSVAEQIVLYQELAAHDAPRLVLAFVGIHHAASTLLEAGTEAQRRRHLPAILDGEIWVQGFSEPEAGSDLASLRTTARRQGETFVVNGQKLWASGGMHADWCLLLARTDPNAPKRKGISYFLLDMKTPGIDVRPIRNAIGESHFCEVFLNDVEIPAANLVGAENAGWQVAQATLGAERGMTMLELAERLGNAGYRWLVEASPTDDPVVADQLTQFEIEIAGLRGLCRDLVEGSHTGAAGPADASIVKLYYSELLQRMTDFGVQVAGVDAHTVLTKPMSSGWESGSWVLDFIGSWEWTIPGGASEIQRTIIAERGLGLPTGTERAVISDDFSELHDELRSIARDVLGKERGGRVGLPLLARAGWTGLEVSEALGGAGATFRETAVVCEELGAAGTVGDYLGGTVLSVGLLNLLQPSTVRDELLSGIAAGEAAVTAALSGADRGLPTGFTIDRTASGPRLNGANTFVADASAAAWLLVPALEVTGEHVVAAVRADSAGLCVLDRPVVDETRSLADISADSVEIEPDALLPFAAAGGVEDVLDRAYVALACDSLGLSTAMLTATVDYTAVRQQFGRPIGSFQAVKHACADMLVQVSVARQLVRAAGAAIADADPGARRAAAMAKAYTGAAAVEIAGKAMQLHGGIGYTWESGIHAYLKRATLNRALFGSPAAHRRYLSAEHFSAEHLSAERARPRRDTP